MRNLTASVKTMRLEEAQAIGAELVCNVVDTQGYDAVRFIAGFNTLTTPATMKVQQSGDNAADVFADLAGSEVTAPTTDGMLIVDVVAPRERFLRPVIDGTSTDVVDFVLAELYRAREEPVDADTTVLEQVILPAPAEGTA